MGWGWGAQAHSVAAVLIDHYAAGEGLVVGFDEEGPLPPVQHVSLHEDYMLNARNLQGKNSVCVWGGASGHGDSPRPRACSPAGPDPFSTPRP